MHKLFINIWTSNVLSSLALGELTALSLLLFDFHDLVALSKTIYCPKFLYLQLFMKFFLMKNIDMQERPIPCRIWLMGSQSIKASNAVLCMIATCLVCDLYCISNLPTPKQFKNELKTIQPQDF